MSEKIIRKKNKLYINSNVIQKEKIIPNNKWLEIIKKHGNEIPFNLMFKEGRFVCYDIDFVFEKYKEILKKEAKEKLNKKLKKAEEKIEKLKDLNK